MNMNIDMTILFVAIIGLIIIYTHEFKMKKEQKLEQRLKQERELKLRKSGIFEVDNMSGEMFEEFLKTLLQTRGFNVSLTKATGDYGADLILSTPEKTIVVQAKRYKNKVGVKAVQEIVSAKNHYGADECWVITNNYFTEPAKKLGFSNEVFLIDRDRLIDWILDEKNEPQII
ncbi:restriction endonuclease [Heyndrickxia camelliae]|uniref:Restriction endonuclease n=1 Tax=Heyndrickxia camelliae TaxID=1707093 RepID=A0A2N3LCW9_9BACI|nr:restriction endonuclease [Heyndrickxia camelliae]PKR82449.1 restriction endonuclease [Heyndrickxia camelliae]